MVATPPKMLLLLLIGLTSAEETREEEWPFYPMQPYFGSDPLSTTNIYLPVSGAYRLDRKMPPSCECRKTGDTDDDCELFECSCVCDLTAGACDYNCCCDEECSAAQRSRFEDLDSCVAEGPVDEEITKCYTTKEVDSVNPKFPMSAKGTAKSSVDRFLCVRYDNSDLRGEFYDDPGMPSDDIFDDTDSQKDYDYPLWAATSPRAYATDREYDAGDRIVAAYEDGSGYISAFGGYLPLPTAGENGECVEMALAIFATPAATTCWRRYLPSDLAGSCDVLGSFRFSTLYLGSNAGASPAGSEFVAVEIQSVQWRDPATGSLLSFASYDTAVASCDASYDASLCTGGTTVDAQRPAAPACRNALYSISYTIIHLGGDASEIARVLADIVLTDVPEADDDGAIVLEQHFSVRFQERDPLFSRSADLANLVNRSRSGNPGYLVGRPVLAGTLMDAATSGATYDIIRPQLEGLTILGGSGTCNDESDDDAGVVPFGADMSSGCVINLNRTELRDFCTGMGPHAIDNAVPRYFNVTGLFDGTAALAVDRVGIFGNADPLDATQWLSIAVKTTTDAAVWQEERGLCESAVTSMNYRFIWAYVGKESNPQAKIIAARVDFSKEDLVARDDGTGSHGPVVIRSTATFIEKTDGFKPYSPPSPPVAVSVPYDVWCALCSSCVTSALGTPSRSRMPLPVRRPASASFLQRSSRRSSLFSPPRDLVIDSSYTNGIPKLGKGDEAVVV